MAEQRREPQQRSGAVEVGDQGLAGGQVHDRPHAVERAAGLPREMDAGCDDPGVAGGAMYCQPLAPMSASGATRSTTSSGTPLGWPASRRWAIVAHCPPVSGRMSLTSTVGHAVRRVVSITDASKLTAFTPATLDQLMVALPALVPGRLDELLAAGVIEECDPGYCVPSPSLLQLAQDTLNAGYTPDRVLELLTAIRRAAADVADAVVTALAAPPESTDHAAVAALATRGRGLLAHGTGRLTIHALGRRLGITDEAAAPDLIRQLLRVDDT